MLAFLGWNPGTEEEIMSITEMAFSFDLNKVHKAGAKFDPDKAKWFNHKYLVKKTPAKLANLYQEILRSKNIEVSDDYVNKIVCLIKDRANFVSDFWEQSYFFFQAPEKYDQDVIKKRWKEETPKLLSELKKQFEKVDEFDLVSLEKVVQDFVEEKKIGLGQLMNPLRITLVGAGIGPGVLEIAELIGKEETIKRIKAGIEKIK